MSGIEVYAAGKGYYLQMARPGSLRWYRQEGYWVAVREAGA